MINSSITSSPPPATSTNGVFGLNGNQGIANGRVVTQGTEVATTINKCLGSNKFTRCLNFIFHPRRSVTLRNLKAGKETELKRLPKETQDKLAEAILLDWFKGGCKGNATFSTDVLYRLSKKVYIGGQKPPKGKTIPVSQEQYKMIQSAVESNQKSIQDGLKLLKNNDAAGFRRWAIGNSRAFETIRNTVSNAVAKTNYVEYNILKNVTDVNQLFLKADECTRNARMGSVSQDNFNTFVASQKQDVLDIAEKQLYYDKDQAALEKFYSAIKKKTHGLANRMWQ